MTTNTPVVAPAGNAEKREDEQVERPPLRPAFPDHSRSLGLKHSHQFGFEGGTLGIYVQGYGDKDGSGYFAFQDEDLDWEADERGRYKTRTINICQEELIAIRDQLIKAFPIATPNQWRPINEAPRDGTKFDLLAEVTVDQHHVRMRFKDCSYQDLGDGLCLVNEENRPIPPYFAPTHFIVLPAPPSPEAIQP